ncbi:GTPase [Micromonospora cremea]|uniref:50S ribosome-binding GTPase n=1 Tax=Micromonospora cremea TaxID=709881 RepID=A0A1N5U0L9_9ACTN|nr:GTPase domain-containing protein [Micromonospora cremea]SIM53579.1 50S ribosome-binding GTPase [Micromonospora cremea]
MSEVWAPTEVTTAAATVLGSTTVDQWHGRWQEFAGTPSVRITVAGPYNTGKSSLLKRLLVDAGATVPGWLTASARRETFLAEAVAAGDITYVDTPGLDSGEGSHDAAAAHAIALTDALVLLIGPQLVLNDVERAAALVEGTFLAAAGGAVFPPGALLLVIARGDTMGTDPVDGPEGYRQLCERKRAQLHSALQRALPGRLLPEIVVIAADSSGAQARRAQPQPAAYDRSRPWDGVGALSSALAGLSARRSELRTAAAARHWRHLADAAITEAGIEIERLTAEVDGRRALTEQLAALRHELDTADASARTRLQSLIVRELTAVVHVSVGEDQNVLVNEAIRRIEQHVEAWLAQSNKILVDLTRRAKVELQSGTQAQLPTEYLRGTVNELLAQRHAPAAGTERGTERLMKAVDLLAGNAQTILSKVYEAGAGMTLENARLELGRFDALVAALKPETAKEALKLLDQADVFTSDAAAGQLAKLKDDGPARQLIEFLSRPGGVTSPAHAANLAKRLRWTSAIGEAAPVLFSLTRLGISDHKGEQLSREQQRKREELTHQIAARAPEIAELMLDGPGAPWAESITEVREALRLAAPFENETAAIEARRAEFATARATLTSAYTRHRPLGEAA